MEFLNSIFKTVSSSNISGLTDELKTLYINYVYDNSDSNIIVLTSSLYEATKYYNSIKTYNKDVLLFPMDDFLTSVAIAISPELKIKRLETLQAISNSKKSIVVTNLMGFLRFVPNEKTIEHLEINIKSNSNINRESLEKLIDEFGYTKTSLVTSSGEYSIRGFVIDIFPFNYDNPMRIELFGNSVEKIKMFDSDSQLTLKEYSEIKILPYKEIINKNYISIYELLNAPTVIRIDSELINQANESLNKQIFEYNIEKNIQDFKYMFDYNEIVIKNECNLVSFNNLKNYAELRSQTIDNFNSNYKLLEEYIEKNINKYKIFLYISNKKLFDYIVSIVKQYNTDQIKIVNHKINQGFIIDKYLVIGENDIEKSNQVYKYQNPVKIGRKIKDFNDIKIGDYVVHSTYGIGIYGGVITLTKNGIQKDYLLIKYLGTDKVYIPVEKIDHIFKYADKDGTQPKINKLNSTSWIKTKNAIKNKVKDISEELLKLYAQRSSIKKEKYHEYPEEVMFANDFAYDETRDQTKCISEIIDDLKKDIPMDRLLCGDVGFGKTEVAFRGIFNTVLNGYQVAYLCPTTILSKQQYDNAINRFKNFPVTIALVNRFTTEKEYKKILEGLKIGSIDIVFGTHKLFNKSIEYKNLGLLVVDEEQRFGVTHKEKIKELKTNINVLTLSATPIPRTLKMAISGLRDLSILDTAPADRYPIQTYVVEKNDLLIKDAIYKELSRDGQVYYLFNDIKNIIKETNYIKKLVPEARICYAHGQMPKTELEKIFEDFINHEYDIIVCTTIIETGIDISNVNTLIINNAQNYGLSQLYQLRGRIGRSNKIGYAYLTYNPAKVLTETAVKRLKAIKEFTELGSGYKIAMRDLSIRGAGDILGSEQAGFIDSVGIDLYTKMIHESMKELNGEEVSEDENDQSLIDVDTHIEESYVSDESVRIEIHKMINGIEDYKSLQKIKEEIEDRFGKITEKLEIYMYEEWFEKLASKLNIRNVIQTPEKIEFQIPKNVSDKINGEKLFLEIFNINSKFKLRYFNKQIVITLPIINLDKHYIYYLANLLQKIVDDINY